MIILALTGGFFITVKANRYFMIQKRFIVMHGTANRAVFKLMGKIMAYNAIFSMTVGYLVLFHLFQIMGIDYRIMPWHGLVFAIMNLFLGK